MEGIKRQIRQIVFGAEDGLVSIFGLVIGVYSTDVSNLVVGLAGLAGALSGAISMAAGTFLSSKSGSEILKAELVKEKADEHIIEALNMCRTSGMTEAEVKKIEALLITEIEEEQRQAMGSSPFVNALWIFFPYIVVSSAPISPFFLIDDRGAAVLTSIALTLLTLFVVGSLKTRFTKRNVWKAGFEMVVVGSVAAILAYAVVLPFSKGI